MKWIIGGLFAIISLAMAYEAFDYFVLTPRMAERCAVNDWTFLPLRGAAVCIDGDGRMRRIPQPGDH